MKNYEKSARTHNIYVSGPLNSLCGIKICEEIKCIFLKEIYPVLFPGELGKKFVHRDAVALRILLKGSLELLIGLKEIVFRSAARLS